MNIYLSDEGLLKFILLKVIKIYIIYNYILGKIKRTYNTKLRNKKVLKLIWIKLEDKCKYIFEFHSQNIYW